MDSCASPDNEFLMGLYPDRTRISTLLFALRGPVDHAVVRSLPRVRALHKRWHSLVTRPKEDETACRAGSDSGATSDSGAGSDSGATSTSIPEPAPAAPATPSVVVLVQHLTRRWAPGDPRPALWPEQDSGGGGSKCVFELWRPASPWPRSQG
jgi:hypothetical protein